jgi:hypothetical protein
MSQPAPCSTQIPFTYYALARTQALTGRFEDGLLNTVLSKPIALSYRFVARDFRSRHCDSSCHVWTNRIHQF